MQDWKLQPARDHGLPLGEQIRSTRREGGLVNAITNQIWCSSVALYLKAAHRLSIEGREHLPESGSFVLVANHASHLDSLILVSSVARRLRDRVFPVAAGDTFFSSPLTGIFSALFVNALPMWRQRKCGHALADLRERLTQDQCIFVVFPEGTRTRTGTMAPFKAGLGMLVAGTSVPVVPCRLTGTFQALPPHRRLPRPTKVCLKIGKPISFMEVPNDRNGWQTVANATEAAVIGLG
jgi:1-acyl-sn-glycerol-3-phosphate acyltransferase